MRIFAGADKRFGRNRHDLVEVARSFLGPVEHDHRGRDFGQASNLAFLSWLSLIQNKAGLRIHNREGACGVQCADSRQAEREKEKSDEKATRNSHRKVKPLHLNRRGLVGNRQSDAMLSPGGVFRQSCSSAPEGGDSI